MTTDVDHDQIKTIIHGWADAVHAGDLERVLEHHGENIVMFDVPPPEQGVRGIDAYSRAWPAFFEWQRSGASFEIVELDVTAGDEVAFAWALLLCGTPQDLANAPTNLLRLTIGLQRQAGDWKVVHEHHSFTDRSTP